jgi:transcription antitermination factor NusG
VQDQLSTLIMKNQFGMLAALSLAGRLAPVYSFAPNPVSPFMGRVQCSVPQGSAQRSPPVHHQQHRGTSTSLAANKLWDRLQIEEDEEPMWYLLNCVAGLEIDLLRQCRMACEEMPDAYKFVVPTEIKTRSHGASRMVTEVKVKYLGYVFAKIRLCPEVYEALQELDLCRSWMGTVNHKGHKKLPPAPQALNEIEVENFGLEEVEWTEEEVDESGVILDTAEQEAKSNKGKRKVDEEALKVYLGLRVDDMVKVTAANKFFDEDGIVRRLKDGRIFVRFYTYGSMFEEWLNPEDMRKLSEEEAIVGLTGPSKPVSQDDIDGKSQDDSGPTDDWGRPIDDRRGLGGNTRGANGDLRNRRQDRVERGDGSDRGRQSEDSRNEKNWNWYKDQQGSDRPGAADPNGVRRNRAGNDEWAQGDVDSQWGRKPQQQQQQRPQQREQRPQQREQRPQPPRNRQDNRQTQAAMDGSADWSSFVSPAEGSSKKDPKSDDFFESLMTDLSKDLGPSQQPQTGSRENNDQKNEDDFFASLMSELSDEHSGAAPVVPAPSPERRERASVTTPQRSERERAPVRSADSRQRREEPRTLTTNADEDFFASLEAELGNAFEDTKPKSAGSGGDDSDDFFAKLEAELAPSVSEKNRKTTGDVKDVLNLKQEPTQVAPAVVSDPSPASKKARGGPPKPESSNGGGASSDLGKCTVPVLKEMLKERGLKVSGKKADLIERLS